jgi:hypothetical protein
MILMFVFLYTDYMLVMKGYNTFHTLCFLRMGWRIHLKVDELFQFTDLNSLFHIVRDEYHIKRFY